MVKITSDTTACSLNSPLVLYDTTSAPGPESCPQNITPVHGIISLFQLRRRPK